MIIAKKEVMYNATPGFFIEVGLCAYVYTLDHPNTKNYSDRPVRTSTVLNHNKETGDFETQNTMYRKIEKP